MSVVATGQQPTGVKVEAVVIRKDGTREDFGVTAASHRNPAHRGAGGHRVPPLQPWLEAEARLMPPFHIAAGKGKARYQPTDETASSRARRSTPAPRPRRGPRARIRLRRRFDLASSGSSMRRLDAAMIRSSRGCTTRATGRAPGRKSSRCRSGSPPSSRKAVAPQSPPATRRPALDRVQPLPYSRV